ncbi:CU044_5270 family protein [Streptosporangium sp. CA-135522]|uniref:CU044_5270 family protein n=1 Tax=Streptosporangium sp. CA-135522 TaxID=3240072 RepID=UPI003D8BBC89
MNEMTRLERFRSEIPQSDPARLRAQEDRLLAAIAASAPIGVERAVGRRRFTPRMRLGLAVGLAAAVAAGGMTVAVGSEAGDPPVIHTMPVAAAEVLKRAAENVDRTPELHPKPGQFLVFESQTMNPSYGEGRDGRPERYLSRSKRKVWLPVKGDSTGGVIEAEELAPKPFPGWPIPPEARETVGRSGPEKLADFDQRAEFLRNDYAYVSRLPTDPAKMYEHLYTRLGHDPQADTEAWARVNGLLSEAYLPAAQRAALFRAAAAIPGVVSVDHAVDAAGRTGIAAARIDPVLGERHEYIFDRETYMYLGERSVVTDADRAEAPVGTVLTSSAQLKVSVADHAPAVNGR